MSRLTLTPELIELIAARFVEPVAREVRARLDRVLAAVERADAHRGPVVPVKP